jgi:hypothetical protein
MTIEAIVARAIAASVLDVERYERLLVAVSDTLSEADADVDAGQFVVAALDRLAELEAEVRPS